MITFRSECRERIFWPSWFSPSSLIWAKSKGFIFAGALKEKEMYSPPTAVVRGLYSLSGSMTITSVPVIRDLNASSFTKYDFPAPEVAKMVMFAFSRLKRSKIINDSF